MDTVLNTSMEERQNTHISSDQTERFASHSQASHQLPPQQPVPQGHRRSSNIKIIERITVWIMALSAIFFALISILAIWGAFDEAGDIVGRSLASLAVIAFTSLVINIAANILDPAKKK